MGYFLTIAGFLGVPTCLIVLIVKAIRKKKLKTISLIMAGLFVCFIVGIIIMPKMTVEEKAAYEVEQQLKIEQQERARAEKEEAERIAAEQEVIAKAETERIAAEQAEQERLGAEAANAPPTKDELLALAAANSSSYKDLLRTPDDYIDQYMVLTVKLNQVLEGGWLDDNVYYFGYTDNDGYEWYFDDKYCFLDGRIDDGTKLLESDVLRVYGRFVGAKTFTTALIGTDSELPCVEMLYVEILE